MPRNTRWLFYLSLAVLTFVVGAWLVRTPEPARPLPWLADWQEQVLAPLADNALTLRQLHDAVDGELWVDPRLDGVRLAFRGRLLGDGGHATRSPEAGVELLFDLLTLDDALGQRGRPSPEALSRAIDRLSSATRFFTLGDGHLAAFHGGETVGPARIAAALAHDDAGPRSLNAAPHSGYHKMIGGSIEVIADCGPPPAGPLSVNACAQPAALEIVCAKDRHGTHQRGHTVADVHICTTDDGIGVAVVAPAETFRPTGLMEKVSRFLEETPTASTRHILAGVAGKDRHIRTALDVLLAEGFVRSERGGHGGQQWSSREPFRDPANPENATAAPRPHRGPESGPRLELDSEALRPHINRARPPRPTAAPPAGRGDRGPTAAPPEQNATKDHETSHRSTAAPRPHRGPASGPRSDGRPRPRGPDPLRSRGPAGQQSSLARDETGNDSQTTAAPTSDVPISADPIDPIDDGPCDPFAPLDGEDLL